MVNALRYAIYWKISIWIFPLSRFSSIRIWKLFDEQLNFMLSFLSNLPTNLLEYALKQLFFTRKAYYRYKLPAVNILYSAVIFETFFIGARSGEKILCAFILFGCIQWSFKRKRIFFSSKTNAISSFSKAVLSKPALQH